MKPPPLPPALPSLSELDDDLEDITPDGHASAKHLLAQLVESNNRQNHAIIAQNRVLREIADQFHEAWTFARDANIRSQSNERRITEVDQRLSRLKEDVARSGLEVQATGSFIIPPDVAAVVESHARRKVVEAQAAEDRRKIIFSVKEKLWIAAVFAGLVLLGAGCTVVIYEVAHRGPSIPTLPGAP